MVYMEFRRNLINELIKKKHSILVVAPEDPYTELIIKKVVNSLVGI